MELVKLPLKKGSKVYVVAPAGVVTGGPEDLYQLAESIRDIFPGVHVYMYYIARRGVENPVAPEYEHFGLEVAEQIEDDEDNVLILPECYTTELSELTNIKKAIWWLGVDGYYTSNGLSPRKRWFNSMMLRRFGLQWYMFFNKDLRAIKWNYVQNRRFYEHLRRKKMQNVQYLIDHVNPIFAKHEIDESLKEDIVLYNPVKGYRFTRKLIKASPDIKFFATSGIPRLTEEEKLDLMKRAKVYIDFGNHPGGDRFPKETALFGCCVITGRGGTANYFDDVPIPRDFKFSQNIFINRITIFRVRRKIKKCFADYHNQARRFIPFRERARRDHLTQREDVRYAFSYEE
jgi:hypothetical protein